MEAMQKSPLWCIKYNATLGSMHIGPLTAHPDQQLVQEKEVEKNCCQVGKAKCCQVRLVANDSTHSLLNFQLLQPSQTCHKVTTLFF